MNTFKTWLESQLSEMKISPTKLAAYVGGLNQPTIHRILNPDKPGGTPSPGEKTVKKITEAVILARKELGLLPLSNGNTYVELTELEPQLINLSEHPDLIQVQRVRFKLSAGVSGFAVESEDGNGKPIFFRKDWFESNNYNPSKLFGVRVSGASMEPALWDGDMVVVNTADTEPHDGDAFAINYEGELVIKRMRRDAGEWFATSDNADQRRFSPKRCTEDVVVIGRVIYKQSERI